MAIKTFIPELWSTMILATLRNISVAEQFINHQYEGEIRQKGDTVKINILDDVTVNDYDSGTPITYEDLSSTLSELKIDQAKYCAIKLDDVDKIQAAGELLGPATDNIAYKLNDAYDKFIFDTLAKAAASKTANMVGTDGAPIDISDNDTAIEVFVDVVTKANRNNIPNYDRRAVVTPEVAGAIMKSDKRSITPKFEEFIRMGYIGNLYGVEVFSSNNLAQSSGGNDLILLTTPMMTTVANQLLEMEALRSETSFKDLVRALHVYGAKTVYDTGVVGAYVTTSN